jgi:hypothetical protein
MGRTRTLGMGIDSVVSPPMSSSRFLMRIERSATSRSTFRSTPSEVVSLTLFGFDSEADIVSCGWMLVDVVVVRQRKKKGRVEKKRWWSVREWGNEIISLDGGSLIALRTVMC